MVRRRRSQTQNSTNNSKFLEMITTGLEFKVDEATYTLNLDFIDSIINNLDEHYHKVSIPKHAGGSRSLFIPSPVLKALQRYILPRLHNFAKKPHVFGLDRKSVV